MLPCIFRLEPNCAVQGDCCNNPQFMSWSSQHVRPTTVQESWYRVTFDEVHYEVTLEDVRATSLDSVSRCSLAFECWRCAQMHEVNLCSIPMYGYNFPGIGLPASVRNVNDPISVRAYTPYVNPRLHKSRLSAHVARDKRSNEIPIVWSQETTAILDSHRRSSGRPPSDATVSGHADNQCLFDDAGPWSMTSLQSSWSARLASADFFLHRRFRPVYKWKPQFHTSLPASFQTCERLVLSKVNSGSPSFFLRPSCLVVVADSHFTSSVWSPVHWMNRHSYKLEKTVQTKCVSTPQSHFSASHQLRP